MLVRWETRATTCHKSTTNKNYCQTGNVPQSIVIRFFEIQSQVFVIDNSASEVIHRRLLGRFRGILQLLGLQDPRLLLFVFRE